MEEISELFGDKVAVHLSHSPGSEPEVMQEKTVQHDGEKGLHQESLE